MDDPEFLKSESNEPEEGSLERLSRLVAEYQDAANDVDECEEALRLAKERFNKLSMEEIPMLLRKNGLSRIRLADGKEVTIKEDVSVTITNEQGFFQFLTNRGEEDIVKLHFDFARMEPDRMEQLFDFLHEKEYEYDSKKDVHAQTRKKYFRELLGVGESEEELVIGRRKGHFLVPSDLTEFANVYSIYTTKVS